MHRPCHSRVGGHGDGHDGRVRQLSVLADHHLIHASPDSHDSALWRVEDGAEVVHGKHPQVRHAETPPHELFGPELALPPGSSLSYEVKYWCFRYCVFSFIVHTCFEQLAFNTRFIMGTRRGPLNICVGERQIELSREERQKERKK